MCGLCSGAKREFGCIRSAVVEKMMSLTKVRQVVVISLCTDLLLVNF